MALPTVTVEDFTIELGMTRVATEFLTASDSDGDSIENIWVLDNNASTDSAKLIFQGTEIAAGTWFAVDFLLLNQLVMSAGTAIGPNQFQFRAEAGGQQGPIADAMVYSVVENTTRPILQASTARVIQSEFLYVSDFISASDPDGHPIHRYRVFNANPTPTSAKLELNGTILEAGQWHYVDAADWGDLRLNAAQVAPDYNPLWVRAFDKGSWSISQQVQTYTDPNLNRPIVIPTETNIATGETIAVASLFDWFDADGSTLKSVRFLDTSPHSFSGNLRESGVDLAANVWHERDISALANMEWVSAERNLVEQVRVQLFDGNHWSDISTFRVQTDEKPVLGVSRDFTVRQQLEFVNVSSLYFKEDDGPAYQKYEIFDPNTELTSGNFRLGADTYEAGMVHEINTTDFFDLEFKSGKFEARSLDPLYVRAFNGTYWSDWTRHNVRTEPEYLDALVAESWLNYRPTNAGELEMTFSFMQGWPTYGTAGEAPEGEFIRAWPGIRAGVRQTFPIFESFLKVDFEEVADTINGSFGRGGDIRFGTYCLDSSVAAYASFPGPEEVNGDIFLNRYNMGSTRDYFIGDPADPPCGWPTDDDPPVIPPGWNIGEEDWQPGSQNFAIVLHEEGHAMGLKHPFEGTPVLPAVTNNGNFSVMSYTAGTGFPNYTMGLYDVAALQSIYGADLGFATGDNVYDAAYFGGTVNRVATVWDAGGSDTFDMSSQAAGGTLDLRPGSFSTFGGAGSIGIAFNTDIENAIGGSGNDVLTGNEFANVITGNDGDDEITGYGGDDMLRGGGGRDRYIYNMSGGHDTIDEMSGAGRDTIAIDLFNDLDDFAQDIAFTRENFDLVIDFKIDEGISRGSIRIEDQGYGRNRIESFELLGTTVDLRYLYENISSPGQRFNLTTDPGQYGVLVTPV